MILQEMSDHNAISEPDFR